jgi:protein gp37
MAKTKIEWCDKVWNPTTGCAKVSSGCKNCYAERIANRFWKEEIPIGSIVQDFHPNCEPMEGPEYRPRKFTDVQYHPERLDNPLHWRKPARVFVDSMSDLFHPDVPFDFILAVWRVMAKTNHTFMILTKRPERMKLFVNDWLPGAWGLATLTLKLLDKPLPNVWLGVSVEDQKTADERIPLLLQTPAAVRFVSYEPALSSIDLEQNWVGYLSGWETQVGTDRDGDPEPYQSQTEKLDWVIMGCESGPGRRPMNLDWARSIRDQCVAANVPYFLKQAEIDGELIEMPALDGKIWSEFPE